MVTQVADGRSLAWRRALQTERGRIREAAEEASSTGPLTVGAGMSTGRGQG